MIETNNEHESDAGGESVSNRLLDRPQPERTAPDTRSDWDKICERVIENHHKRRLKQEFEQLSEEADWVDG